VFGVSLQNGIRNTTYKRLFSTAAVLAGKQVKYHSTVVGLITHE